MSFIAVVFFAVMVLANLVFASNRLFGVLALSGGKSLALRVLELGVCYLAVMGGLRISEARLHGSSYAQGWEFYAISICLALVMVFPGFVYRYLWKKSA